MLWYRSPSTIKVGNTGKNQVNRWKLRKFESLSLGVGDHDASSLGHGRMAGGCHGVGFEGIVVNDLQSRLLKPRVQVFFRNKKLGLAGFRANGFQVVDDLVNAAAV